MNRHRGGDRYSDSDNDNDNASSYNNTIDNQDSSYPNRRPSRFSDAPSRFSDAPSRFVDSPVNRYSDNGNNNNYSNYNRRSPNNYHGGGGGRRPFDSPPGGGAGGDGGFRPMGGGVGSGDGGFRPMGGAGGGFVPNYQVPPSLSLPPQNISGRKRGFHGSSPDRFDGSGGHSGFAFAKLFVGSVPRTATEMDIRPLFEEHGNVIEVALIKDKRTGQQQVLPKPDLFNGQNAIVAVNVHLGYNQADSLVMKRASLERGMFRSEHIRSYKAKVDNKELTDKRRKSEDSITFGKIQSKIGRVDSLDDDGFPFIGANMQSGDIVIGKCAESGTDHSVKLKRTERGIVQKVVLSSNDEGKNFINCV